MRYTLTASARKRVRLTSVGRGELGRLLSIPRVSASEAIHEIAWENGRRFA